MCPTGKVRHMGEILQLMVAFAIVRQYSSLVSVQEQIDNLLRARSSTVVKEESAAVSATIDHYRPHSIYIPCAFFPACR